jgi:transposase
MHERMLVIARPGPGDSGHDVEPRQAGRLCDMRLVLAAGPDRAAVRRRADRSADRRACRVQRADSGQVARPVRRVRACRAAGRTPRRTQPILPLRPGIAERQTHDYARHGVTSLFAALNVATGQVTDACDPKHRHQEFLKFLNRVAAAYPDTDLHVVLDNYATHKHPKLKEWLAKNPRVMLHFTPTSCSWLNRLLTRGSAPPRATRAGAAGRTTDRSAEKALEFCFLLGELRSIA